jgi:hypothetical protein
MGKEVIKAAERLMKTARKLEVASGLMLKALNHEDEDALEEAITIVCRTFGDCVKCPISEFNICDHFENMECSIECTQCARLRFCVQRLEQKFDTVANLLVNY